MSQQKTEWILELKDMMSSKLNNVDAEILDVKKDYNKLKDEIAGTDTAGVDNLKESFTGNTDAILESREAAIQFFGSLATGDINGISAGISGLAGNVRGLTGAAWGFVATPVGAAIAGLAVIGLATKEWVEFNEEAREANILVKAITNAADQDLSKLRVYGMALQETFGGDWQEHLRQINSLQKGFKITSQEAFNVYTDGMIRGGRANDEFRDSIREYPKLFEKYGFAAKDFINIINDSADASVWSDKMPDAIKEFGLAVTEQTQPAKDALENAFGKRFTDTLFRNIRDGAITVREALKQISDQSEKSMLDPQQQAQLTADLFKGAGEDAGGFSQVMEIVNKSLSDNQEKLSGVEQKLSDVAMMNLAVAENQAKALESDNYKVFAQEVSMTWKQIQNGWYIALSAMQDGYIAFETMVASFTGGIVEVFDNFYDLTVGNIVGIKNEIMDLVDAALGVGNIWDAIADGNISGAIDAAKEWKNGIVKEIKDVKDAEAKAYQDIAGTFVTGYAKGYLKEKNRQSESVADYDALNPVGENGGGTGGGTGSGSGGGALGINGGNGGGGRVINMTLDIKNYFNVANANTADVERLADQIIGKVVDQFRDSALAIG